MLFRSTCSWPFSEENPLRVASEALNIHLVSCILYLVQPLVIASPLGSFKKKLAGFMLVAALWGGGVSN